MPRKFKVESGLLAGKEFVLTGRVFLRNNSGKDVTILYRMWPAEFLRAEIFDKDGKRVVNEFYANERRVRSYSPIDRTSGFKLPAGKKVSVEFWDPTDLLREAKQYETRTSSSLTSRLRDCRKSSKKDVAFILKAK